MGHKREAVCQRLANERIIQENAYGRESSLAMHQFNASLINCSKLLGTTRIPRGRLF